MLKLFAAAVIVVVPAMLASLPAQALTSRQYHAQGHGRYLNSSGTPQRRGYGYGYRHHRRYHRHHYYR